MKSVEGKDSWRPGTRRLSRLYTWISSTTSNRLYYLHVKNGYANASPPSSPVYTSRPTFAQFENSQAWETTRKDGASPATADPAHSTAARPRTSHLAPRTSHLAPRTSHRLPLERVPPTQQQQQGMSTGTTEEPTPATWRVYGYYPGFPSSSPTVCTVSTPTPPSPAPSQLSLTFLSFSRVCTRDMVYRRFGMPTSPFQMQMAILMSISTSSLLQLLHLPFPTLVAASPCFDLLLSTPPPLSNNTPRAFHMTKDLQHFSKTPSLPYAACICTQRSKRAMGKGRELDWTKSSATAVDLRAVRGATPTRISP